MGLWCSVEKFIFKIIKCGLADDVETNKLSLFADAIIMGMAVCVLLTVLIDGQVFQRFLAYLKSKRGASKLEREQVLAPQPARKVQAALPQPRDRPQPRARPQPLPMPLRRDPNCPCHGDNAMW